MIVNTFVTTRYQNEVFGGSGMWRRLLCAIDQFETGQTALSFAAGIALANNAQVQILHIRELPKWAQVVPLETAAEADHLVSEAVHSLRDAGVRAGGRARSLPQDELARRIVEESLVWECDAIVLGSRRLHGLDRLSSRGVRERVLRLSSLPVLVAPTSVAYGKSGRRGRRSSVHVQSTRGLS